MSKITQNVIDVVNERAKRACTSYGMEDWEDIAQSVLLYILEREEKGNLVDIDETSPAFLTAVNKFVTKAVNDERTDYMYFRGAYVYPRPLVERALENLLWAEPGTIDEAETKVDVKRSYDRMSENYRMAIYKRYALGQVEPDATGRKTLSRAIDALMHDLNFRTRQAEVSLEEFDKDFEAHEPAFA